MSGKWKEKKNEKEKRKKTKKYRKQKTYNEKKQQQIGWRTLVRGFLLSFFREWEPFIGGGLLTACEH